jgi:cyclin C
MRPYSNGQTTEGGRKGLRCFLHSFGLSDMAANFWSSTHCNRWLLKKQEVAESNKKDLKYLSPEDLKKLRIFFAQIIVNTCKQLGLRQRVAATAIVYFKRFYVSHSFVEFDPGLVAATCIYLSSKVEECSVRVESITKQMEKIKEIRAYTPQEIVHTEFYLLEGLLCDLIVFHPYRCLSLYIADINLDIMDVCWKIVNDSLCTDVCLLYPPYIIALSSIYLAAVYKEKDITPYVTQWFSDLNVDMKEIKEVCQELVSFYDMWGKNFDQEARNIWMKFSHNAK